MKSHKRSRSNRAYNHGLTIGLMGKNKEKCPFESSPYRQEWMNGWRDGQDKFWNCGLKYS